MYKVYPKKCVLRKSRNVLKIENRLKLTKKQKEKQKNIKQYEEYQARNEREPRV